MPTKELNKESRWLSVDEISSHLGVVEDTIYRWIEHRGLPAHRVGKLWKFQTKEVDVWVKSGGAGDPQLSWSKERRRRQRGK